MVHLKRITKHITVFLLSLVITMIIPLKTFAKTENEVSISLIGVGVTHMNSGSNNSWDFYDYDATIAYSAQLEETCFVTAYYIIEGLPYDDFDLTIDYGTSPQYNVSYPLQSHKISRLSGVSYDNGENIESLKHGTRFYYDIGDNGPTIGRSAYTTYQTDGAYTGHTMTFHVNDFYTADACIAICYYVQIPTAYTYAQTGEMFTFNFKVNSVKYTLRSEQMLDAVTDITTPSASDKTASNQFQSSANSQTGQIDSLVSDMSSMNKPSADSLSSSADVGTYITDSDISGYAAVLSTFTGNRIVLTLIMGVLTISLVSYVLFGKR